MGLRTVLAIAFALTTLVQSAPQFSGDGFLEDKRLYLKGAQKKKADYILKDNDRVHVRFEPPADIVVDEQGRWPTQAPWPKDYWLIRKTIAEERVRAALRTLSRNRPSYKDVIVEIIPRQSTISSDNFNFPVGNRARRHKRDLMEVNVEGSPLTAVYKDNVIAEVDSYGLDKKTDEPAKNEATKLEKDMSENNVPDMKVPERTDTEMKSDIMGTKEKMDEKNDMITTPKPPMEMDPAMNNTAPKTPEMVEMVMNMENSTYVTKPDDMMMSNTTMTTMMPEASSTPAPSSSSSAPSTPAVETKVSPSKGYQLCSEDGLSCTRTTSSPEKSTVETTTMPSSTSSEMMVPSSNPGMMDTVNKTTEEPMSTTVETIEATAAPAREEHIEKIPFVSENKPPVPVVVLQPVDKSPEEVMTTEKPELDMKPMLETGRSFDTASGLEVNLIPVDANQTENTISSESSTEMMTKMPELVASEDETTSSTTSTSSPVPTEKSTTPSTKSTHENETKDESVMGKIGNWFENAWDSVKNWF